MDVNVQSYFCKLENWQLAFPALFDGASPKVNLVSSLSEQNQNLVTLACLYTLGNHVGGLHHALKCNQDEDLKARIRSYGLGVWKNILGQFGFAQLVSTMLDITSGKIECDYAPSPAQFLKYKTVQRPAYLDERPRPNQLRIGRCYTEKERNSQLGYLSASSLLKKLGVKDPGILGKIASGFGYSCPAFIDLQRYPYEFEETPPELDEMLKRYNISKSDLVKQHDTFTETVFKQCEEIEKNGRLLS